MVEKDLIKKNIEEATKVVDHKKLAIKVSKLTGVKDFGFKKD